MSGSVAVLTLLIIASAYLADGSIDTRVDNGNSTIVSLTPYAAALFRKGDTRHYCGGTILSNRVIATSACCVV